MRVAVIQSSYIPWKGYFDIIHDVDVFVFYDDVQYTKNDWRNRNRIKTPQGAVWLTIPVGTNEQRRICDVRLPRGDWARKHWRTLEQFYARAPHFGRYKNTIREMYLGHQWEYLCEFNQAMIELICRDFLGIVTVFRDSREVAPSGTKQERLLELLTKVGATAYVSGPSAKAYIDPQRFEAAGIELYWKDYSGYPEYPQLFPPFRHDVTVLDLLFNVGPEAPFYIWGWREGCNSCGARTGSW